MLDVIKLQKEERDLLLSKKFIERSGIAKAKKHLDTNLIKVIVGPRRAGKSFFGFLLLRNKNFAYLNFDDDKLIKVKNTDKLVEWLSVVYPNYNYLFLDEIQNLPNWEVFVNKLQRRGVNLVLTGSNSKLLSGELASNLTGRYIQIDVMPLSFFECKGFNPRFKLNDYLLTGGYPEVVINGLEPSSYLKTLFEAILFKDVTKRYNLRQPEKIYDLGLYLLSNFASRYSFQSLKTAVGLSSVATTQKYVQLLENTFLFFSLNKFDFKLKKQFGYDKKVYAIDNGFLSSVGFRNSENLGRILENTIFIELLRRGFVANREIFYYKTKSGKEVDFIVKKGPQIQELIQVCLQIEVKKTKSREVSALKEASLELKCQNLTIITLETQPQEKGIKITPAEDFLNTP